MERSVECSRYMTDVLENALELRHAADVLVHEHEQRFYEVPPIECSIERSIECPIERSNQGKLVDQSKLTNCNSSPYQTLIEKDNQIEMHA